MTTEEHPREECRVLDADALDAQIAAQDAEDAENPNTPTDITAPADFASGWVVPREG